METVPIFSPDGVLGDIPYDQMKAALAAGGKPGVTIKSPDGRLGVVPADRYADAVKAGGSVVPFHEQENQHPGVWHALVSDLASMVTPHPGALGDQTLPGRVSAGEHQRIADNAKLAEDTARRKAAGYSSVYRTAAPVAEGLGVNVPGMEQAAQEGDVGGVVGHAAAVPAVMAATYGGGKGISAAGDLLETPVGQALKAGGKAAAKASVKRIPYIGPVAGDTWEAMRAAYNEAQGAPKDTPAALSDVQQWWKSRGGTLKSERPNGPIRGRVISDAVDEVVPPSNHAENLLTKAKVEFHVAQGDMPAAQAVLDDARQKFAPTNPSLIDEEAEMRLGTAEPPEPVRPEQVESKLGTPEEYKRVQEMMAGRNAAKQDLESGRTAMTEPTVPEWPAEYQNAPQTLSRSEGAGANYSAEDLAAFKAKHNIDTSPTALEQKLAEALGGRELEPGVPLRNQVAARGFTPVESSALKGFKYDPTTREFHSLSQNGQHYIYGDVSPEQTAAFEQAESKGKAWNELRNSSPLVAKVVNGKRVSVQPMQALRSAAPPEGTVVPQTPETLTELMDRMLKDAQLKKKGSVQ